MAKVYDNIRIYGDLDSAVYVGDKGATLPADLGEPSEGFTELGWLSEDGISEARSEDAQNFRAYQGGTIVRRKKTSVEDTITFQCLEETAAVVGLRYAGQTPTATGGVATINVKEQTKDDPRAFIVDVVDGGATKRYVVPIGYAGSGTLVHSNSAMTVYEFTVTIVGDYDIITDSPGVVAGAEAAGG